MGGKMQKYYILVGVSSILIGVISIPALCDATFGIFMMVLGALVMLFGDGKR